MSEPISKELQRALTSFRTTVRRLDVSAAVPPLRFDNHTAFTIWQGQAISALQEASQVTQQQVQNLQKSLQSSAGVDDKIWNEVEKACTKVEDLIRNPPTLKARLDEGRRSLMPHVVKLVGDTLQVQVDEQAKEFVIQVDPKCLEQTQTNLKDEWLPSWIEYSLGALNEDLELNIHTIWHPRHADLPVAKPVIRPFTPPHVDKIKSTFHASLLRTTRDKVGLAGGVYRHFRTILYGVMSIAFLTGLRSQAKDVDPAVTGFIMLVVGVAAVAYGVSQAKADKESEKAKFRAEVESKAERQINEAIRHCLDRASDKLNEYIRQESHQRRLEYVSWYRQTILPAKKRSQEQAGNHKKRLREAQANLRPTETKLQAIQKAITELKAL